MREFCALGVSYEGYVFDKVGHGGRGSLDRPDGSWDMLDSFLAGLEEVGEVGYTESIEIGFLGGNGSLSSRTSRGLAGEACFLLDAVQSAVVAP
jgi:hypothetical protein